MGNIILSENLKLHFLRLYKIALSDSQFNTLDIKWLYDFALKTGISEKYLDEILQSSSNIQDNFPETLNEKVELMYDLSQMIWADGKVDEKERYALEKYIRIFGFLEENIVPLADFFIEAVQDGISKNEILQKINS